MARYLRHNHKCCECGKQFSSSREDAKFCGATCRSRAHRKIDAKDKAIAKAKAAIAELMQYCNSPIVNDCLQEIIGWITNPADQRELVYKLREVQSEER